MGWLRDRHGMFWERTQKAISSAELALEFLKLWSDPKITAADSPILLVLMNSSADPKWLEPSWLIVLRYCLGTCPRSVSNKECIRKLKLIVAISSDYECATSLSEWVKDEWPSLIQYAFTDQHKEITIWLEKKIKALIPPLIYLCSILANGVQQKQLGRFMFMLVNGIFVSDEFQVREGYLLLSYLLMLCIC